MSTYRLPGKLQEVALKHLKKHLQNYCSCKSKYLGYQVYDNMYLSCVVKEKNIGLCSVNTKSPFTMQLYGKLFKVISLQLIQLILTE